MHRIEEAPVFKRRQVVYFRVARSVLPHLNARHFAGGRVGVLDGFRMPKVIPGAPFRVEFPSTKLLLMAYARLQQTTTIFRYQRHNRAHCLEPIVGFNEIEGDSEEAWMQPSVQEPCSIDRQHS